MVFRDTTKSSLVYILTLYSDTYSCVYCILFVFDQVVVSKIL